MIRDKRRMTVAALCLTAALCSDAACQDPARDSNPIEGLWSGSWGGGERDGVVFQPVIAEMFVKATDVELHGFRGVGGIAGTIRLDASAKQIQITPATKKGAPPPKALLYAYEIKGDRLTLIDSDKFPITLQRVQVVQNPLGNARVELVNATEINGAGDLLVTEFREVRVGRAGAAYFMPVDRVLSTKQATVGLVQESGWREITVDEARKMIRETPVAVVREDGGRRPPRQLHKLWRETGAPKAGSEAVRRMLSRTLRPGTVVFILAHDNIPQP